MFLHKHALAVVAVVPLLTLLVSGCGSDSFVPVTVQGEVEPPTPAASTADLEITPLTEPTPTETVESNASATPPSTAPSPPDLDCLKASFISDVTIPDGTRLDANEIFLKIWRLKNTGDCAWPDNLMLIYLGGDELGTTQKVPAEPYPEGAPLTASMGERAWAELGLRGVNPGEMVDLPLMFQAPGSGGDYYSLWALNDGDSEKELLQIYVQIRVDDETPEPTIWSGMWVQQNLHIDGSASPLFLEQRAIQVRGYFYTPAGELYLLEGGLFDGGRRVAGTFGPPYHDGFPFEWQLAEDTNAFRGSFQDQLIAAGAWCGWRDRGDAPVPCLLSP